jgi:hypothetical protein
LSISFPVPLLTRAIARGRLPKAEPSTRIPLSANVE